MDQHQPMRGAGSTAWPWASSTLVSILRVYYVSLGFLLSVLSLLYRCNPPVSSPVAAPALELPAATSARPVNGSLNSKLRPRRSAVQLSPALAPAPPKGILLPPRPHSTPPLDGKGSSLSHSASQESIRVYFVDSHLQSGTGRRLSAASGGRVDKDLGKAKENLGPVSVSMASTSTLSSSPPPLPVVMTHPDQDKGSVPQAQNQSIAEPPKATRTLTPTSTKLRKSCLTRSKSYNDLAEHSSASSLMKVERHSSESSSSSSLTLNTDAKTKQDGVQMPLAREELITRFELGSFWGLKKKRSATLRTQPYAAPYFCEVPGSPGSSRPGSPSPSSSSSSASASSSFSTSCSDSPLVLPVLALPDQELTCAKTQRNKSKLQRPSSSRSLNPRIIVTPS